MFYKFSMFYKFYNIIIIMFSMLYIYNLKLLSMPLHKFSMSSTCVPLYVLCLQVLCVLQVLNVLYYVLHAIHFVNAILYVHGYKYSLYINFHCMFYVLHVLNVLYTLSMPFHKFSTKSIWLSSLCYQCSIVCSMFYTFSMFYKFRG